jgi:hypothetical protein
MSTLLMADVQGRSPRRILSTSWLPMAKAQRRFRR